MVFYPKLEAYIADLVLELRQLPQERKTHLEHLPDYIIEKKGNPTQLNFISFLVLPTLSGSQGN